MAFGNATKGYVKKHSGGGGGGGTSNYNDLSNKPKINGIELIGNKSSSDLNISGVELKELTRYSADPVSYIMPENYTIALFVFKYQSSYMTLMCPKTLLDTLDDNRGETITLDCGDASHNNKLLKEGNIISESSSSSGVYRLNKVYYI